MANKYPSPKAEFLSAQTNIDQHNRLIEMPSLQRAFEVAKAEYYRRLNAMGVDPAAPNCASDSAMLFQRVQGVEDFCLCFFNLAEKIQLPLASVNNDNLEPFAKKK